MKGHIHFSFQLLSLLAIISNVNSRSIGGSITEVESCSKCCFEVKEKLVQMEHAIIDRMDKEEIKRNATFQSLLNEISVRLSMGERNFQNITRNLTTESDMLVDNSSERLNISSKDMETESEAREDMFGDTVMNMNTKFETLAEAITTETQSQQGNKLTITTPEKKERTCQNDWIRYNNKCYYFSEDEAQWEDAEINCTRARLGGHLVKIDDARENEWIKSITNTSTWNWIGFSKLKTDGNWRWVSDASLLSFEDWHTDQPSGNGLCGEFWLRNNELKWDDENCNKTHKYVCNYHLF